MKIADIARVEVNWMEGWGNNPELQFILKRDCGIMANTQFRWRQNGQIFYAECENEVRFLSHNRNDHNGYGFAKFHLHMADDWDATQWRDCRVDNERDYGSMSCRDVRCTLDGRILTLTGPWSSGASVVSSLIGPVVSVSTLTGENREAIRNPRWYQRMKRQGREYEGLSYATVYTLSFIREVIDTFAPHLEMYEGDYGWYPVRKGDQPKNPRRGRKQAFDVSLSDEQSMVIEW